MPPRRNRLTSMTFQSFLQRFQQVIAKWLQWSGSTMLRRLRLWIRRKWAWRQPASGFSDLPFDMDEFARLLSSHDPAVMKQLANDLAKPVATLKHPGELPA
jgi:hypothetical protein